jgi:hypothetical protein
MDVRLDDGRVVTNVPEGTTKSQLMARLGKAEAAPVSAKPSPIVDAAESFGSGLVRGAAELPMLPITAKRALDNVGEWIFDKADNGVRRLIGAEPLTTEQLAARSSVRRESAPLDKAIYGAQDKIREGLSAVLHKPETTLGEYAGTVGEFVAPGGVFGKAGKAGTALTAKLAPVVGERVAPAIAKTVAPGMGDVVAPALASEAAGQATEGQDVEPFARMLGAIFGSAGTALVRARENAPQSAIRRSVGDTVTPEQWDRAKQLNKNEFGVNVSGPNAVQQSTNEATMLGDLQRVVENSLQGGAVMKPYFNKVPGQVDTAVNSTLDKIAPAPAAPSGVGSQSQRVAEGIIDDTRQKVNAETRPSYAAAEPKLLNETEFTNLASSPRFKPALDWVRTNLPELKDAPDNSIAIVDAVSKRLADEAAAAGSVVNSSFSNQIAGAKGDAAKLARDTAREASPEYQTALNVQASRRQDVLSPLENGPVGKLAATDDTRAAVGAVLPKNPLPGSEQEVAKTVMRIGEKDPDLAATLVRLGLADDFSTATSKLVGGDNYYGGARFAKEVAGKPQTEANLQAALRALPDGRNPETFSDLVDVLRATGRRKPQGSATSFNNEIQNELGVGSLAARAGDVARSGGTSFLTNVNDKAQRLWLGKNTEALANMFIDPDSIDIIRSIAARQAQTPFRDAAIVGGAQSGSQARDRKNK